MRRVSKWLRLRLPSAPIAKRAKFVVQELGEYYSKTYPHKPGQLPPIPPEDGRQYEDELLRITWSDRGDVKVYFNLDEGWFEVFHSLRGGDVVRFNYGDEWVEALNDLYVDLKSKEKRAEKARFQDVD